MKKRPLYRGLFYPGAIVAFVLSAGPAMTVSAEPLQFFSFDIKPAFGLCIQDGDVVSARVEATDVEGEIRYSLAMTVQDPTVESVVCNHQTDPTCVGTRDLPPRLLSIEEAERLQAVVDDVLANVLEERGQVCPLWDPCRIDTYTVNDMALPVNPCAPPWIEFEQGIKFLESLEKFRDDYPGGGNGDVNGDQQRDASDAIALLTWLLLGGPQPVFIPCPVDCAGDTITLENGDINADFERDIGDALGLLTWLFLGTTQPAPICFCE